jgi:hypothetical protein
MEPKSPIVDPKQGRSLARASRHGFWKGAEFRAYCLLGGGAQLSVTLASRGLSPPLSNFDDVVSVLELHERELIKEALAAKKAVTAFRKVRHEAGACHECGAAQTSTSLPWRLRQLRGRSFSSSASATHLPR